ncbi:MAG: SrfA family protein [Reyranellaceae bacterium]
MAGTTLVRTTLTGVRPLGVRGEPLHTTHEQIRGVIRRRLGERHARLLAEPQPDDAGRRIDWYSDAAGDVAPLGSLPETARMQTLAHVDTLIADIAALGVQLQEAPSADARITGRALELACRRPSDDYVFMVGEQPVVVCWGYEPEAAGALLPPASPATTPATAEIAPPPAPVAPALAPATAPVAAVTVMPFPWLGWLLASALAVVLSLITAYVLRQFLPEAPTVTVAQLPPPPAPPAPPPPLDPRVGLQTALGAAQSEAERLQATLASLRDQFAAKRAACPPPKPPEPPPPPPKPPQVVEKKPPPPPPKPPQEPILKLPPKATNDYSFLKGCWRGDSFRYTPRHSPGYHTYCFDEHGNGRLVFVWQSGTTCSAPAHARFQGDTLQIADADATCSDGSPWTQDRLLCRPDASGIAQCSGETNLPGPGGRRNPATSFTVRLHRR